MKNKLRTFKQDFQHATDERDMDAVRQLALHGLEEGFLDDKTHSTISRVIRDFRRATEDAQELLIADLHVVNDKHIHNIL